MRETRFKTNVCFILRSARFLGKISRALLLGNTSGWGPIISVVNGIDSAHWSFASLFFDNVRDESWRARDHEYAVERCGIHSQVGENGADCTVYIDRERFLGVDKCFLNCARRLHVHAVHTRFARELE